MKPLDPNKILTDPEAWQTDALGNVALAMQQQNAQTMTPLFEAQASQAKRLSKADPKNSALWQKYGKEIEALGNSQNVDPRYKGLPEYWDQAAQVIAAQHIDEIAQERAQRIAAEMRPSAESGDVGGYSAPAEAKGMEALKESEWGQRLLRKYGPNGVMRNLDKLREADPSMTLEKYAKMAAGVKATMDPDKPGEWKTSPVKGRY